MDIKKELLKITGTKYMYDFTNNVLKLLIKKDESNRELIEKELSKIIEKEHKEHMEVLNKSTQESAKWDLSDSSCIGGQLSPKTDNDWLR